MRKRTKKKKYSKKKGGTPSPNTSKKNSAAKNIQRIIRGNKGRKRANMRKEINKRLETLPPDLKQRILSMSGRGKHKRKKSKKLTNKKRKSRSKHGG
jgi:hypothetical protein